MTMKFFQRISMKIQKSNWMGCEKRNNLECDFEMLSLEQQTFNIFQQLQDSKLGTWF